MERNEFKDQDEFHETGALYTEGKLIPIRDIHKKVTPIDGKQYVDIAYSREDGGDPLDVSADFHVLITYHPSRGYLNDLLSKRDN